MPFFKACGHPGCPEDAVEGKQFCAEHQLVHNTTRKRQRRTDKRYNTVRWRKLSKRIREAADYTCALCGRNEVELGGKDKLVADHFTGDYDDFWNPDKLRCLCLWCSGREDGGRPQRS